MLIVDVISVALIISGALFCLATAIGLVRFRDTIGRMHASTKPQTLGLTLTLAGTVLHIFANGGGDVTVNGDLSMLILILLFALMTSPIIGNRIGHIVQKEGLVDHDHLSRDDVNNPRD
ncbi:monovalent cation/H(+) antiporter subunit G [uncultured Corynebacterium sp.]|uniref:monovalent cation/H(+) antiporter subunit G n=1 Tax=uncultured Corynebacterium sp. TaxID=159447 RepID=UPI0025E7C9DB|nr:monovalent cation/H(+) antiporter subunit G [uncultured Corynebacterium sp.]